MLFLEISDEEADEQPEDFSSNEDMSDSEPIPGEDDRHRSRKFMRGPIRPFSRVSCALGHIM